MMLGRVWVRLAAAASAALIMGAMVMLLGMALTAGVAPGLPHANAKPGDNHGTPGDNKKKKKDDDDNDRDNRGSDSRDSSSDSGQSSGSTNGGNDQKAQTEQNNRWTPDGSNRSVDTRIDSPERSQQTPPRQEQPVYEGTPDDGSQDAAQPPAMESATPPSVSVEEQNLPRIVLPPQGEFQYGDQVTIEVPPANSTGNTDTTNTVIAVTAAGLGGLSRFRGGSRGSSSPAQRGGFGLTHLGHETGDQTLVTMNDPSSPDTYEFDTSNLTPDGGSLRLDQDGSVSILDASGGDTGNGFTTPWAHDANGLEQPTNFTVEDTTLTQHIQPRPDAVYPITADPNGRGGEGNMAPSSEPVPLQDSPSIPPPPPWEAHDPGAGPWGSQPWYARGDDIAFEEAIRTALPFVGSQWPNATNLMDHYLDNTGEAYSVNVDDMMRDVPGMRDFADLLVNREVDRIVHDAMLNNQFGVPTAFRTAWSGFYIEPEANNDWFHAVGGVDLSAGGVVTVSPPEAPEAAPQVQVISQIDLADRYNWDAAKEAKVGPITISDKDMAALQTAGLAREFNIVGRTLISTRTGSYQ